MEQYFTNFNNNNQTQLYSSDQHSIETLIPVNNGYNIELQSIKYKRNSTVTSSLSLSHSSTSSINENNDLDQNVDDNDVTGKMT